MRVFSFGLVVREATNRIVQLRFKPALQIYSSVAHRPRGPFTLSNTDTRQEWARQRRLKLIQRKLFERIEHSEPKGQKRFLTKFNTTMTEFKANYGVLMAMVGHFEQSAIHLSNA